MHFEQTKPIIIVIYFAMTRSKTIKRGSLYTRMERWSVADQVTLLHFYSLSLFSRYFSLLAAFSPPFK